MDDEELFGIEEGFDAGEWNNTCEYCAGQGVVGRRYSPDWKLVDEACPKCSVASPPRVPV